MRRVIDRRLPGAAAGGPLRPRRDDRPERPGPGEGLPRVDRPDRDRPDQARLDRQGRHRLRHRAGARGAGPLRRRGGEGRRPAAVRSRRVRGGALRLTAARSPTGPTGVLRRVGYTPLAFGVARTRAPRDGAGRAVTAPARRRPARPCSTPCRERLRTTLGSLTGRGRVSEADVDDGDARGPAGAARGGRQLQGRQGLRGPRPRAGDRRARSWQSLNAGQQVVKIVNEELTALLSAGDRTLPPGRATRPSSCSSGLQGSGKTTTAAKLARHIVKHRPAAAARGRRPVPPGRDRPAGDPRREPGPAGLSRRRPGRPSRRSAGAGSSSARTRSRDTVILDTAGRLTLDEVLMAEMTDADAHGPSRSRRCSSSTR